MNIGSGCSKSCIPKGAVNPGRLETASECRNTCLVFRTDGRERILAKGCACRLVVTSFSSSTASQSSPHYPRLIVRQANSVALSPSSQDDPQVTLVSDVTWTRFDVLYRRVPLSACTTLGAGEVVEDRTWASIEGLCIGFALSGDSSLSHLLPFQGRASSSCALCFFPGPIAAVALR